jgi:hypothetical protein
MQQQLPNFVALTGHHSIPTNGTMYVAFFSFCWYTCSRRRTANRSATFGRWRRTSGDPLSVWLTLDASLDRCRLPPRSLGALKQFPNVKHMPPAVLNNQRNLEQLSNALIRRLISLRLTNVTLSETNLGTLHWAAITESYIINDWSTVWQVGCNELIEAETVKDNEAAVDVVGEQPERGQPGPWIRRLILDKV